MKADLHMHALPHSADALSGAGEMMEAAKRKGVGAVAFTDHGYLRGKMTAGDLLGMGEMHGVRVFPGVEIETHRATILVYGLVPDLDRQFGEEEVDTLGLLHWVRDQGGVSVVAHLTRSFLPGREEELLTGAFDWWLRYVDALELTWNGDHSGHWAIEEVAERLGKRVVRGSDAHYHRLVGRGCCEIPDMREPRELVEWFKTV